MNLWKRTKRVLDRVADQWREARKNGTLPPLEELDEQERELQEMSDFLLTVPGRIGGWLGAALWIFLWIKRASRRRKVRKALEQIAAMKAQVRRKAASDFVRNLTGNGNGKPSPTPKRRRPRPTP